MSSWRRSRWKEVGGMEQAETRESEGVRVLVWTREYKGASGDGRIVRDKLGEDYIFGNVVTEGVHGM